MSSMPSSLIELLSLIRVFSSWLKVVVVFELWSSEQVVAVVNLHKLQVQNVLFRVLRFPRCDQQIQWRFQTVQKRVDWADAGS